MPEIGIGGKTDGSVKKFYYKIKSPAEGEKDPITEGVVYSCQDPKCNAKTATLSAKSLCACGKEQVRTCWYQKVKDGYRYIATDTDHSKAEGIKIITKEEFDIIE